MQEAAWVTPADAGGRPSVGSRPRLAVLQLNPAQARLLDNPVRRRLATLLQGGAQTTESLARHLGIPRGTASYHVKTLERAGLLQVVATRPVRAVLSKYYGLVAERLEAPAEARDATGDALDAMAAVIGEFEATPHALRLLPPAVTRLQLRPEDAAALRNRLAALLDDAERRSGEDDAAIGYVLVHGLYPAARRHPRR